MLKKSKRPGISELYFLEDVSSVTLKTTSFSFSLFTFQLLKVNQEES